MHTELSRDVLSVLEFKSPKHVEQSLSVHMLISEAVENCCCKMMDKSVKGFNSLVRLLDELRLIVDR